MTVSTFNAATGPLELKTRLAATPSLTQSEYERFRDFVLAKTGLYFAEENRHLLERGLAAVMASTACGSLDQLYALLQNSSSTSPLWDTLTSALTVGETYFFRNLSHFNLLAQHILPEFMARGSHASRRLRIWSAGCASGEEPYSVAILLRELTPNLDSWNISILATDINREALRKAQAGVYGAWSFRGVEPRIRDAYFRPDGKQYVIADSIKRMVTFEYLNLVSDPFPSLATNTNAMDVILCRNVTIYFSAQVTAEVLRRFHACLTDGGWLIPGPSEPNLIFYGDFEPRNLRGAVVYQKPAAPRPQPEPIEAPESQPTPDAYVLALSLLEAGQTDEAMIQLHRRLDQDANFAPACAALGKLYANTGNLDKAQHWCERAIQIDRLRPEPYYTLSMIYEQHGLFDLALEALKKAIYLNRDFALAHFNLGQIYLRRGENHLAHKSFDNARRLLLDRPRDEPVLAGDGLVAGRLMELAEGALADEHD
jgi:chemotaxis protein methyltransferase CheR